MRRRTLWAILAVLMLLASKSVAAAGFPTLLTADSLFNEGQRASIQRDADLAQRTGVPTMFVILPGDATSAPSAQSFADQYRSDYAIESAPGADDGLVFVVHWIANDPAASTVVYSAGENAFKISGLNETSIEGYLTRYVLPRLQAGNLFDATTFLMRMTRSTGLYQPPPAREIAGAALTVQRMLTAIGPLAAIVLAAGVLRLHAPSASTRYRVISAGLLAAAILTGVSVWTHSRIGIGSVVVMVMTLLIWGLWTTRDDGHIDWRAIAPDIAIAVLLIAISFSINWQRVNVTPGDRDETRWINRGYYAADLIDPFGPTWQDSIITVGQPPLGSIAIGIGMAVQGQDLRAAGVWDYQYDKAWFQATGGYPTEEAFTAARRTNAFIGALATGAAYVLGRVLTNRAGGVAAGVYLAWHPLHIVLSTQALSDETFALMLVLALIAAWHFGEKPTWGRALLLGVLLGLGGATKLTPLLLAPGLAGAGVLRLLIDRTSEGRSAAAKLIAQPFIAFAAFVAIYPWLWENPLGRTYRLFAFRASEMDVQTTAWPNALVDGPLAALGRFGYKLTYTHSTSQKALQHLYDWLGIQRTAVGFDLVLAAAGVVILLWWIARDGLWNGRALVAVLLAGEMTLLVLGMKADFYRYHLPVIVIMATCLSISTGVAWSQLRARIARRQPVDAPSLTLELTP